MDRIDLTPIYLEWLCGKSLRYLARKMGVEYGIKLTHTSLYLWLNAQFGDKATDPVAMSLQRSLLEDYEGRPEYETVKAWVLENLGVRSEDQHRSKHSIKQLTLYQTCPTDEILEYIAPDKPVMSSPKTYHASIWLTLNAVRYLEERFPDSELDEAIALLIDESIATLRAHRGSGRNTPASLDDCRQAI